MTPNILWAVSLSNGETLYENKGAYQWMAGQQSPWLRLLSYLKANNLTITSLSLYTEAGQRFNLPALGKNPKFKAFMDMKKPIGFKCYRRMGADIIGREIGGEPDLFTVGEADFGDAKLQIWVNEKNPMVSWLLIV